MRSQQRKPKFWFSQQPPTGYAIAQLTATKGVIFTARTCEISPEWPFGGPPLAYRLITGRRCKGLELSVGYWIDPDPKCVQFDDMGRVRCPVPDCGRLCCAFGNIPPQRVGRPFACCGLVAKAKTAPVAFGIHQSDSFSTFVQLVTADLNLLHDLFDLRSHGRTEFFLLFRRQMKPVGAIVVMTEPASKKAAPPRLAMPS